MDIKLIITCIKPQCSLDWVARCSIGKFNATNLLDMSCCVRYRNERAVFMKVDRNLAFRQLTGCGPLVLGLTVLVHYAHSHGYSAMSASYARRTTNLATTSDLTQLDLDNGQ